MTARSITDAALHKMVELEGLIAAKKQATWQQFRSSGENKTVWFRVIDIQDNRIKVLEREIKACLGVGEFKARRGWGK